MALDHSFCHKHYVTIEHLNEYSNIRVFIQVLHERQLSTYGMCVVHTLCTFSYIMTLVIVCISLSP